VCAFDSKRDKSKKKNKEGNRFLVRACTPILAHLDSRMFSKSRPVIPFKRVLYQSSPSP
jgi:hypothetical protein